MQQFTKKETTISVQKISAKDGKAFVKKWHYTHGIHNGPVCYGMIKNDELVGVCAFANPSGEKVCENVFGAEHKRRVTELHRLVLLDEMPKNSESWFIAQSLKQLKKDKPHLWAVLSFADSTMNHYGTIYKACNAIYTGKAVKRASYIDQTGRLRHQRQNGKYISVAQAAELGWVKVQRGHKFRYLFLLPDNRKQKKELMQMLQLQILDYPKMQK